MKTESAPVFLALVVCLLPGCDPDLRGMACDSDLDCTVNEFCGLDGLCVTLDAAQDGSTGDPDQADAFDSTEEPIEDPEQDKPRDPDTSLDPPDEHDTVPDDSDVETDPLADTEDSTEEEDLEIPMTIEDSFADFADGTFPGSLANLYVTIDGTIRSIDVTDINQDGNADLVFANYFDGETFELSSYGYLGPLLMAERRAAPDLELATIGAAALLAADLDADGAVDLLFANSGIEHGAVDQGAYLYRGTEFLSPPEILAAKATPSAIRADLDRDGYLDVIVLTGFDFESYCSPSFIHWGGEPPYTRQVEFGTRCFSAGTVADVNEDGFLDIIVATCLDNNVGGGFDVPSQVFLGDGTRTGFGENVIEVDTYNAYDVAVADLDRDGHLDLVFSESAFRVEDTDSRVRIFWGDGQGGFSGPTLLVGHNAVALAIDDLDGDHWLDLVVANFYWSGGEVGDSYIYWNPGPDDNRNSWGVQSGLETVGVRDVFIHDLNADGENDIVFANFGGVGGVRTLFSYVYWGPAFAESSRGEYYTEGAKGTRAESLGNTSDRGPYEVYQSSVLHLDHVPTALYWRSETPFDTSIGFRLRSADSAEAITSSPWLGPTGADDWYQTVGEAITSAHGDDLYFQYQARFDLGSHRAIAILDWVGL